MKRTISILSAHWFLTLIVVLGLLGQSASIEDAFLVRPYLQLGSGSLRVLWQPPIAMKPGRCRSLRNIQAGPGRSNRKYEE